MSRLESLPKFMRSEQPPKVLDLPFPPFKLEHRYRGVYERAGFDVNLANSSKQSLNGADGASLRSGSSRPVGSPVDTFSFNKDYIAAPRLLPNHEDAEIPVKSSKRYSYGNNRKTLLLVGLLTGSAGSESRRVEDSRYDSRYESRPYDSHSSTETKVDEIERIEKMRKDSVNHAQISPTLQESVATHVHHGTTLPVHGMSGDLPQDLGRNDSQGSSSSGGFSEQSDRLFSGKSDANIFSDRSGLLSTSSGFALRKQDASNDYPTRNPSRPTIDIPSDSQHDDDTPPPRAASRSSQQYSSHRPNPLMGSLNFSQQSYLGRNHKNLSIKTEGSSTMDLKSVGKYANQDDNQNNQSSTAYPERKQPYVPTRKYKSKHLHSASAATSYSKNSVGSVETQEITNNRQNPSQDATLSTSEHINDTFTRKKRLSLAMDDFKRDIEDLKKFTPKSTPQEQPIAQFDNAESKPSDYEQFLQLGNKEALRHSQILMVSLILLKGSLNENDLEIDRELERQLQNLKTGCAQEDIEVAPKAFSPSEDVDHEIPARAPGRTLMAPLPTFKIEQEIDAIPESGERTEIGQVVKRETEEANDEVVNEKTIGNTADIGNTSGSQPSDAKDDLFADSVFSDSTNKTNDRTEDDLGAPAFLVEDERDNVSGYSPVKPLNVRRDARDSIETPPIEDEPVSQSHSESSSHPKSGVGRNQYSGSTRAPRPTIHLPGEGPCRGCGLEILPFAKGSQKAIFSKTGDLSGQWHRSCFQCSNECGKQFKKGIQVYELNDKPHCHNCYHKLNNTVCESCGNGVEGECIENELQQKWHLSCLRCAECRLQIQSDYYLVNGKIFCERDALRRKNSADRIEKRRTRLLFLD